MAAYAVVGALKAGALGAPPLSCIVMGVLTATFGGVIRDVLAHEPSVLLQAQLYVTPALAGATTFVGLGWIGAPAMIAGLAGFVVALAIRAGAILWHWPCPASAGRCRRKTPRCRGPGAGWTRCRHSSRPGEARDFGSRFGRSATWSTQAAAASDSSCTTG